MSGTDDVKRMIATKEKQRAKLAAQLVTIDGEIDGLRQALAVVEGIRTVKKAAKSAV